MIASSSLFFFLPSLLSYLSLLFFFSTMDFQGETMEQSGPRFVLMHYPKNHIFCVTPATTYQEFRERVIRVTGTKNPLIKLKVNTVYYTVDDNELMDALRGLTTDFSVYDQTPINAAQKENPEAKKESDGPAAKKMKTESEVTVKKEK